MADFVKMTTSLWEILHKPNKSLISVTNLITFIGFGYKKNLFQEEKPSRYLELCLAHGNKYEPECIEFLLEKLGSSFHIFRLPQGVSQIWRNQLQGTPDGFIVDKKTGDLGILEVKCPFGGKYGRFNDEEEITHQFRDVKKHFRHWLQLQLYLFLNKERGANFGVLVYYYPGLRRAYAYWFKREELLDEAFCIEDTLDEYFAGKERSDPNPIRAVNVAILRVAITPVRKELLQG